MRLLVVTQEIDSESSTLGFFHEWLCALAPKFESIEAICLKEGKHSLPANVSVHSLGKERGSRWALVYAVRFKFIAWKLRHEYDAVFVHMNQEYILVAGLLWKILGKPVYLWRNHYAGSWLTDLAAFFCTKVFCTSKHSYTAKYRKTVLMPVGVDLSRFSGNTFTERISHSILFLGRISPSKRPDMFIEALGLLAKEGISFSASVVGSPLPVDAQYHRTLVERVKELELASVVTFLPGVPHTETADIYRRHDIFVNCSRSGMFDKTLFEAAACGVDVLAASDDWRTLAGSNQWFKLSANELADALMSHLGSASHTTLVELARAQSLDTLVSRLVKEIT